MWKANLNAAVNSTPFFITNFENGCVVGATVTGCVFILDAGEGSLKATYDINDAVFSSPVVYEKNILIGSRDNFLYCLKLTGE